MERAGLAEVWQRTTLVERRAPLGPVERRFLGEWLAYLAGLAEERGVPEEDLTTWRTMGDPTSPENPVNGSDFWACEGQVVAVGRVPKAKAHG